MNEKSGVNRKDLVYPELSYQVMGVLFEVWKELGYGHKEKFYQKAVSQGLKEKDFKFDEQVPAQLLFKNQVVGSYFFDFLVEDKTVLEIKAKNYFSKKDIDQLYSYLKAKNFKLGILAYFSKNGVKYKRILNIKEDF